MKAFRTSRLFILHIFINIFFYCGVWAENSVLTSSSNTISSGGVYSDPKSFFKIQPPEGWEIKEYPEDMQSRVDFISPSGKDSVNFEVIGLPSPYRNLTELSRHLANKVKEKALGFGFNTVISSPKSFHGFQVIEVGVLPGYKLLAKQLHFLVNSNYYIIRYEGSPEMFKKYEKDVLQAIETFVPLDGQ